MSIPTIHALRDADGLAIIGRTLHDLRGIRFDEGEGGNSGASGSESGASGSEATEGQGSGESGQQSAGQTQGEAQKVEDLPAWAQKEIRDARKEAGDFRAEKNTTQGKLDAILKAAGVGQEEDPVKLLETRTTELTQTASERDDARRQLAIYRAANAAGADPDKLLDRSSFMSSVKGLDLSDGAAIKAAIKAAVDADPTLKTTRAVGASSVESTGGTGEDGQITEAQLAQMTPEQISEAYEKGQLKHLL